MVIAVSILFQIHMATKTSTLALYTVSVRILNAISDLWWNMDCQEIKSCVSGVNAMPITGTT